MNTFTVPEVSPIVRQAVSDFLEREERQGHSVDPAHGFYHCVRVAKNLIMIRQKEGVDQNSADFFSDELGWLAALFHDWVNIPKNSPDRAKAADFSAEFASKWLEKRGQTTKIIQLIAQAIEDHSFSGATCGGGKGAKTPRSFLGKCLQDSDRLESLGAMGIMRWISTGAKIGSRYFNEQDPWASNRPLDQNHYMVDHCFEKILKLHLTFQTEVGRILAKERTNVFIGFLEQLGRELEMPFPPLGLVTELVEELSKKNSIISPK